MPISLTGFVNSTYLLPATCLKTEILVEKRHHTVLEAVCYFTCMIARINFEAVRDSILVENIMQFAGIGAQSVLVAHIECDRTILAKISNVLIHESQRRIGGPFRQDIRLRLAVLGRKSQDKAEDSSDQVTTQRQWRAAHGQKTADLPILRASSPPPEFWPFPGWPVQPRAETGNTGS